MKIRPNDGATPKSAPEMSHGYEVGVLYHPVSPVTGIRTEQVRLCIKEGMVVLQEECNELYTWDYIDGLGFTYARATGEFVIGNN
jgi:hypothetical protein